MPKKIRPVIRLQCTSCKEINYATEKNTREQKERLEMQKFCKHCKKRTSHKETK